LNGESSTQETEAIFFDKVLPAVNEKVVRQVGKHLSKVEVVVLQGSWQGLTYAQIAAENSYTTEYLKNDIGSRLWKLLSQALAQDINKTNCRIALKQLVDQQSSKPKQIHQLSSTDQSEQLSCLNENLLQTPLESRLQVLQKFRSGNTSQKQNPLHNLPARNYLTFVGRESEVQQLSDWLSFEHPTNQIAIEGIGGIGKTSLVLEVAYRCLQSSEENSTTEFFSTSPPKFDAIVFTSARQQIFTSCGAIPCFQPERTLQDILRAIARTLQLPSISTASFEEACLQICQGLQNRRTLLIIDNLETLDELRSVIGFLYQLSSTVKIIVTSREATPFRSLRLNVLPQTDSLQLIQQQAQIKNLQLKLTYTQKLHQITGGIPAAILFAVSQLEQGYNLQEVSQKFQKLDGDFVRFYFEGVVLPLRDQPAYRLLSALALFAKPPSRAAVCAVAAVEAPVSEGLACLQKLLLVEPHRDRYTLNSLIKQYIMADLVNFPEFERDARHRWVEWYLRFVQKQGGKDWQEWQEYTEIEQEWDNISEVIEWCIASDRYKEVCQLWRYVKCYTYSQGYRQSRLDCWDTPLDWLTWLIQVAQTQQDWATAAEIMGDRAWKLTLLGQSQHLLAASILFTQAWELRQHQPRCWQIETAIHIAAWHLEQKQFDFTTSWLNQAQDLVTESPLQLEQATRYSLTIAYYRGKICYKNADYESSQALFEQVLDQAQSVDWKRLAFLAKDFLADIAIQQGKLAQAQQLLLEGLEVAAVHHDQCSEAYIKRSLAQLERQRGHLKVSQQLATEAREKFEALGMVPEAIETRQMFH